MQISIRKPIDTDRFARSLRQKSIDLVNQKILITRFHGSKQSLDLTFPANCGGFGRKHYFYRKQFDDWPENPLPIDPACEYLGIPQQTRIQVQVFQNAACSWRCWYCFVDDKLLAANPKHSEFKSAKDLLDLLSSEPGRPSVIDLSGGQPDLVPEWTLWMADGLASRKDSTYLWSDDNLSNEYLWQLLSSEEVSRLASYPNYGRVGCFKGYDDESFAFNTQARPELFSRQFHVMKRLVASGFDVYGYVTFTTGSAKGLPERMRKFVDRLQDEIDPLFPLRTVPLKIVQYSPTKDRINSTRSQALAYQVDALHVWQEELERRFSTEVRSKPIHKHVLSR